MKAPSIRQQMSNSSRVIGVLTLLPIQDQLNRHPEPLSHLPLLKTHLADVRQEKKKHRKTILENGTSFKMFKTKRQKQNKNPPKWRVSGSERQFQAYIPNSRKECI